jgi:hypothetical protein
MPSTSVSYEVTVRTDTPETGRDFAAWMRQEHIPDVLATGLFSGAELAQLDPTTFRTRYLAASRDNLDRYLAEHAPRLRDAFAARFGASAKASRQLWEPLQRWP